MDALETDDCERGSIEDGAEEVLERAAELKFDEDWEERVLDPVVDETEEELVCTMEDLVEDLRLDADGETV